ncbi:AAA family ATPase [Patescibacteria group bacterium]
MKKKRIFFAWYYTHGIEELLEIWKNFLVFALYFFSIKDLIFTLISPWKRDVSPRNWKGWKPFKSLELVIGNIFSRFIGLLVRSTIITLGLIVLFFIFAAGLAIVLIWIAQPLVIAILVAKIIPENNLYLIGLVVLLVFDVFAYLGYRNSVRLPYREMDFRELKKHGVLKRVYDRMGLEEDKIDINTLENKEKLKAFLKNIDLTEADFNRILSWETGYRQKYDNLRKFWRWENLDKITPIGKNWRYAYTVHLDDLSLDLSEHDVTEYSKFDLVGRENEFNVIKLVLKRPVQNNVLITGAAGIGKKTTIHYLAKLIRQNRIEGRLWDKRIVILEMGEAISFALRNGNDPEGYIRKLFGEAAYAGNTILVIEDIEHYLGDVSDSNQLNIANIIHEFLPLKSFQIIAMSTSSGYHNLIEKQEDITKYFDVVEITEPTEEETIEIMLQTYENAESKSVVFTYQGLKNIIKLASRYKWESPLPERALDLMKEVLVFWQTKGSARLIEPETVNNFVTMKTGIPVGKIKVDEKEKLLNLEKILHQRVIGQNEAINEVAEALRRTRSGIGNDKKPIGSFLFLGPTGVGKTETAKALAQTYFGNEEKMIRLDMSEYQSPGSIDRLVGSSQTGRRGYVIDKVKDNPYSLILMDEIEKAYPDILDLFLQVLDEGFLTDAFGEKVNFRNTIIIATSNAGSSIIKKMIDEMRSAEDIQKRVIDYAIEKNIFRPEFLNRFNGVIFFAPLGENELRSVVELLLRKFAKRLAAEKNIEVEFNDGVVEKIIKEGYNPIFGGRSLNRYIEDKIEDTIVKKIISEEIKKGEKVKITL